MSRRPGSPSSARLRPRLRTSRGAAQASREIAKAFEDQAQIIRTIPDRPWESDDSLRARLTLATALLTWLGPLLLGALSSSVIQPITQAIQVMGK